MAFELFTTDKVIPRGAPGVTITSYGRLALNKPATYRLEQEKIKFVQLLWDPETSRVGVVPSDKTKDSFTISYGANGNGAAFSCVPFLMYIKYDWRNTRNFAVEWDETTGMYIFGISQMFLGTLVSGEHIKKIVSSKASSSKSELHE